MSTTSDFFQFCQSRAHDFLQTALVIEDAAFLDGDQGGPKVATKKVGDVLGGVRAAPEAARGAVAKREANAVDLKPLLDGFLKEGIICGLYKPTEPDKGEMAPLAIDAAMRADIVVVDWVLADGSSVQAKKIISGIIGVDNAAKGRLRLIGVYTSQPVLANLAQELLEDPDFRAATAGQNWSLDGERPVLTGPHARIIFLSKGGVGQGVPEASLAKTLIGEFAALAEGLLSAFALGAVTAIRKNAHHVVSIFEAKLDAAYVLHRTLIPHPDDSLDFAVDLLIGQLANVLAVEDVAGQTLGPDVLELWLERHRDLFTLADEVTAGVMTAKEFKLLLRDGEAAHGKIDAGRKDKGTVAYKSEKLVKTLGWTQGDRRDILHRMARLAVFRREQYGPFTYPKTWRPQLTLGTIIKPLNKRTDCELLYCVQPRCDSVRLGGTTGFPFQKITAPVSKSDKEIANLAVATSEGVTQLYKIHEKPRDAVVIDFTADAGSRCVLAEADGEGRFLFKDTDGNEYEWLGDVEKLRAQRGASAVASELHRVGTDEYEWLRLAGEGKFKLQ